MRFFDDDQIGCFLDDIGHRVEKAKNGTTEHKVIDLTLRVQPFTAELAISLDPDVRALLFTMGDSTPKPKLKAVTFALTIPPQQLTMRLAPELLDQIMLEACTIRSVRARTQKDLDGFALIFGVSYGPASPADLAYVTEWLTQQRFVTFHPQQAVLDFGAHPPSPPRRRGRRAA